MVPHEIHSEIGRGCEFAKGVAQYLDQQARSDHRALWEPYNEAPQVTEMIIDLGDPVDFRHSSFKARLLSFANWPSIPEISTVTMAQAGFYYEGKIDFVKCFYCNGGIMGWAKGDNPFIRHAQSYNDCLYIRAIKGETFMQQAACFPEEIISYAQCDDAVPEEFQCPFCLQRRIRVFLGPCGHLGGCGRCARKQEACPICRAPIMGRYEFKF
jgi:hypothetical protein